jgi:hypothetical protein
VRSEHETNITSNWTMNNQVEKTRNEGVVIYFSPSCPE